MVGERAAKEPRVAPALHHFPGEVFSTADLEGTRWYECAPEWPEESDEVLRGTKSEWADVAADALASASRMFEKRVNGSSGHSTSQVLDREKTVGDKIAAVALLVQESPLHRLDELLTLLSYARKKGRNERGPAIDALNDLFINNLLPDGRRLISLSDRSFKCERAQLTKRHLAYALFESELKTAYKEFLEVLEESAKDSLIHFKMKAVKVTFDLLVAKPENEQTLLSMLVNKLGDPERRISSTASYKLSDLISQHHTQMRGVVVQEVEYLLLRPNVSKKAQYFAINFLNSIKFTSSDVELARRLIRIYMELFAACLAEEREANEKAKEKETTHKIKRVMVKGRMKKVKQKVSKVKDDAKNSRLMGALLIGANRAFPFTKPEEDDSSYEKHLNALYRVAHAESLEPATRALALLFQVSQSNATQSDRFYRTLYSRIMDSSDVAGAIQASFLNLIFKAVKADTNPKRLKAFVKRLMQAGQCAGSGFAAASILVVSEALHGRHNGILKSFVAIPENDDEEEKFLDVDKVEFRSNEATNGKSTSATSSVPDRDHKNNDVDETASVDSEEPELDKHSKIHGLVFDSTEQSTVKHSGIQLAQRKDIYDPSKRDPKFARAERSSLWEAVTLTAHYHPSIAKFAKSICVDMGKVKYGGDPLDDFSDIAFLDKFVYKKAKNRLAKSLYGKKSARYRDEPVVNSMMFQENVKSGKVGEDESFFAKYFQANPNRVRNEEAANPATRDGSDIDSEEEAFEEAMREEMKRLGADDGFLSVGINGGGPDVDEEDEDEVKAFAEAFGNEMIESGDEDEKEDSNQTTEAGVVTEVTMLPAFDDGSSNEAAEYDSDDSDERPPSKKQGGRSGNVFAAAEDYNTAINMDLARPAAQRDIVDVGRDGENVKKRKRAKGNKARSKRRKGAE